MKDALGDRMKGYEERETERRFFPYLPIYARLDGRGFSNFTRKMARPFDESMHSSMIETTKYLVAETHALIGYTQSDEISLLWEQTTPEGEVFFSGKPQKMASILAGLATVKFNQEAEKYWPDHTRKAMPVFDCRVFQLPNRGEAANAILWRERDASKNAMSMAARSVYSHNQLHKKNWSEMNEMLFQKGINFNDYPASFKRGTFVRRRTVEKVLSAEVLARIPMDRRPTGPVLRSELFSFTLPSFNKVVNRVGVLFEDEAPVLATDNE